MAYFKWHCVLYCPALLPTCVSESSFSCWLARYWPLRSPQETMELPSSRGIITLSRFAASVCSFTLARFMLSGTFSSLYRSGKVQWFSSNAIRHPRYPGYTSWVDVMQKLKAAGFNAVSTYFFWGLVEAKKGTLRWDSNDFTNPQKFFQAAKDAGLYVIARPGPYINAEVSCTSFGTALPLSIPYNGLSELTSIVISWWIPGLVAARGGKRSEFQRELHRRLEWLC